MFFGEGILEVLSPDITTIEVELYQLQKYYNGKPLSYEKGDYRVLTDLGDAKLELKLNISLTDVGVLSFTELNMFVEQYAEYKVYSAKGQNISMYYRIIFVPNGEYDNAITVDMRRIEITTASEEKEYDGKVLSNGGYYITKGSLVNGHTVKVTVYGEIVEEGSVSNEVIYCDIVDSSGNSVMYNYLVTINEGTLTVLPKD